MVDPNHGELERMYQTSYARSRPTNDHDKSNIYDIYQDGKPDIDRTNQILKQLAIQTPAQVGVNAGKVRQISRQATSKVAYAYKERFCGVYEDKLRLG